MFSLVERQSASLCPSRGADSWALASNGALLSRAQAYKGLQRSTNSEDLAVLARRCGGVYDDEVPPMPGVMIVLMIVLRQPEECDDANQVEKEKPKSQFETEEDKSAYDRWADDGGNNLD